LPNQGHAGEDGGPQIDACENEYEHCATVGIRGDLHLVLVERMLLIGKQVNTDVVGSKTFVERNTFDICPWARATIPVEDQSNTMQTLPAAP
jgi:hypothetical protein